MTVESCRAELRRLAASDDGRSGRTSSATSEMITMTTVISMRVKPADSIPEFRIKRVLSALRIPHPSFIVPYSSFLRVNA